MTTTTVLPFGGGELSSFDPLDNNCREDTTSGTFDVTHARCSIGVQSLVTGFLGPTWPAASDFWFHVNFWHPGGTEFYGEQPLYKFYEGATVVAQVGTVLSGGGVLVKVYTRQSGALTLNGSFTMTAAVIQTMDFQVVAGASGSCKAYVSGTERLSVAGLNHTDFSGVTQIFGGATSVIAGHWPCHSEIICDTISHVGDSLVTLAIDTASAVNADWSGPVTNINEIVLNDANNVTSSAANQVSTYYKSGFSLGTYNILAVFIGVRAQLTSGSSTNLQVALRTNGSNYFSPTIALDFGYQACCASWALNPATGAAWLASQAAVIEGGMKSIA